MIRVLAVVGLLCCASAQAQVGEASLSIGVSNFRSARVGSVTVGGPSVRLDNGFRLAARFTLNTKRFIGHEFGYAYSRSNLRELQAGLPVHQGLYNFLLYATPEGARFRPFAAGGGHFSSFYPPGTSAYSGNGYTKFGVNYGAGLKFKINDVFQARIDLRDYVTGKPFGLLNSSGMLQQLEYSVGFGIVF
jgi:hypothetical protein